MRLDEQSIRTHGERRAGEHGSELALAAGFVAAAAGLLHGMRSVKHHRKAVGFHRGNGPHVGYEIIVAEGGAALGQENFLGASQPGFFRHASHFGGREELTFLEIDDFAGGNGGFDQIGLAAEERGNLQDIHDFAGKQRLLFGVHIGQHGHVELLADLDERLQATRDARAAKRFAGRAIGFVEASFEDKKDVQFATGFDEGRRDLAAKFFVLDHARAGDEKQPVGCIETFPDGSGIEHGKFLTAQPVKVNDADKPLPSHSRSLPLARMSAMRRSYSASLTSRGNAWQVC